MSAVVFCPINRKGGVGKSTSCFHLGGYFAAQGFRVLLIDDEPQHSLTKGFIGPDAAERLAPEETVAALFDSQFDVSPKTLIHKTSFACIDIVYGHDDLDQFNGPPEQHSVETQLVIKRFVEQVKDQYDFVVIDSPPNLQLCTYAALAACNFTYCVTQPQDFDVQGLEAVRKAVDTVLRTTNPSLRFAGYILNMVQSKVKLHDAYERLLRDRYGSKVFDTTIPQWIEFVYAITAREPISFHKPNSEAAQVIKALGQEMIDRVTSLYTKPPEFQSSAYPANRGKIIKQPAEEVA